MKKIPVLLLLFLVVGCSAKKNKKLSQHPWIVDQAIYESKDNFFNDSLLRQKVISGYEGRQYDFKDDGSFSVASHSTIIKGQWSDGKNESDLLIKDIASSMEIIAMQNNEGFREIWIPWTNHKTIFTDYFGEDRIQVTVLPADESGSLMLVLRKK